MRSAWYRFVSPAGGEMPTSPPQVKACGKKMNTKCFAKTKVIKAR